MALNNFSASIIQRSEGHNAIGKAAYNSRTCLADERLKDPFDFRWKGEIEMNAIYAPTNAPSWVYIREKLWNEVERKEDLSKNRNNAQLARDFVIAIPHELDKNQRELLCRNFGRWMGRQGMVVDLNIHPPDKHGDDRNYHMHMMVTMRTIDKDGFGNKQREWNKPDKLVEWKDKWSEMGAGMLRRAGFELEAEQFRWGHLALQYDKKNARTHHGNNQRDKAIDRGDLEYAEECLREATKHMGRAAAAMERDKPGSTRKAKENEKIKERNKDRKRSRKSPGIKVIKGVARGAMKVLVDLAPPLTPEQLKQGQRRQERDDAEAARNQQIRDLERDSRDR